MVELLKFRSGYICQDKFKINAQLNSTQGEIRFEKIIQSMA